MSSKNKSFNTKLQFGDGETYAESTTYTTIADVISIKPPPIKAGEIEVTNLDTQDEYQDFEPGLADSGESTVKLRWLRSQSATLMSMFRIKKGWRLVYPDAPFPSGSKLRFTGWINGIEHEELTKDGTVEATCTIRVVGKPDLALLG